MNAPDRTRADRTITGEPSVNASPAFPFYYCVNNGFFSQEIAVGETFALTFVWPGDRGTTQEGATMGESGDWHSILAWASNAGAAGTSFLFVVPRGASLWSGSADEGSVGLDTVVGGNEYVMVPGATYTLHLTYTDVNNLTIELFFGDETVAFADGVLNVADLFDFANPVFNFGIPPTSVIGEYKESQTDSVDFDVEIEGLKVISFAEVV